MFVSAKRLAPRFLLTNDNRQLKILDVCKTCSDGTTDLQVIQCNASNQHGYAFRNAYINVLRQCRFIHYYFTFTNLISTQLSAYYRLSNRHL